MSQTHTIGETATRVFTDSDGFTKVVYHSTVVVAWDQKTIILNSGGWHTVTTKLRMNQASSQFNLGFQVFQTNFTWSVNYQGREIPFEDGIRLGRGSK